MNDEEWEKQRNHAITAAFMTGRPVFVDSEGEARYADGQQEPLEPEVGVPQEPLPEARQVAKKANFGDQYTWFGLPTPRKMSWWARFVAWLRR